MSTTLATAVGGAGEPKRSDHPTIVRVMAQADKFAEAMPAVMTRERFMRIAIGAIRRNPKLLECDPLSLMGSLLVAAQLGFEVNTPLGQFYLIPRWNKNTQRMEADGQIGYKGWLDLVDRTGMVTSMTAEVVYEKDRFVYRLGDDPKIEHEPSLGDRGKAIAYYVSIRLSNGGTFRKVLSRSDVNLYRARSKTPNAGPWVSDYDAMALKTTFLRLVTWLPKSLEIKKAVAYENTIEADGGVRYSERQGQIEYVIPEPVTPAAQEPDYGMPDDEHEVIDVEQEPARTQQQAQQQRHSQEQPAAAKAPRKRQPAQRMEVIEERGVKVIESSFTDEPAKEERVRPRQEPAAKAEPKPSPVAQAIVAMEAWAAEATAKHDADGLPDLSDRNVLMERIYDVFARQGIVNVNAKGWYSWLNEIARIGGDAQGAVRLLDQANRTVTDDYMGAPTDDDVEEALEKVDTPVETHGQRVAKIEEWMTKAVDQFQSKGVKRFAKPADVLDVMYREAAAEGLIKGVNTAWRPRITELADCKISLHDLTQYFAKHARAIVEEHAGQPADDREPGADG